MKTVALKQNFDIKPLAKISTLFLENNITDFQQAVDFIRQLQYGRNANKKDLESLFTDRCGTCSTKYALLKQLALENDFDELKLLVGLFRMNSVNTPEVKATLHQNKVSYIPEAHCYLKIGNEIIDVTKINSKPEDFMNELIEEIEFLPFQIVDYKVDYHKNYIENWLTNNK